MDVFYPLCTNPPNEPGIVSAPDIRGTFDIAWSCLAVVLLCTWAVLHENVPVEGVAEDRWQRAFLKAYLFSCKASSFLMALVGPELFTGKAMMCLDLARHGRDQMKEFETPDGVEWTLHHAFLANMGGWAIDFDDNLRTSPATFPTSPTPAPSAPAPPAPVQAPPAPVQASPASASPTPRTPADVKSQPRSEICPTATRILEGDEEKATYVGGRETSSVNNTTPNSTPTLTPPSKLEAQPRSDLQNQLYSWLRKYRPGRWFVFQIPKVAMGNWKGDETNQAQIIKAINTVSNKSMKYHSPQSFFQNLVALSGNIWVVDGAQLHYARKCGIIQTLPNVSEADIQDKSKGDWITKLFAMLQVSWLWVQLIMRKAQGLPSTQLEITTAAIAACSVITYGLYWSKPKDISTRAHLKASRYPTPEEMIELASRGPTAVYFGRVPLIINNDVYHHREDRDIVPWLFLATASAGMILGSVHFASWNSHFPTEGERFGWRLVCLVLVGLPLPVCLLMLSRPWFDKKFQGTNFPTDDAFMVVRRSLEVLYIFARAFIIVESCRSLWYQPSDAFQATSVFDIPHV